MQHVVKNSTLYFLVSQSSSYSTCPVPVEHPPCNILSSIYSCSMLSCNILSYTMLSCTILSYTTLSYTILSYTMLSYSMLRSITGHAALYI